MDLLESKLEYWLALMYPRLVKEAACRVDVAGGMLEEIVGSHMPEVTCPQSGTCCPSVADDCPDLPGPGVPQSFPRTYKVPIRYLKSI